ncbi:MULTISPECIES: hypothetical protein [unclassified Fibrobacter]|jgi:hypothetical protein|uniref:hypothetical protein n=1 Tax=unclassified Fibrobacter TaxID=2634177 RepID=UPI0025BA2C0D|nr:MULTISPECIES: hypothetical protein [unclassified Fibrobacter]
MNFKAVLAAGALLATQSFAIIGIGAHYTPNFGTKMTGFSATPDRFGNSVDVSDAGEVKLWHGGFNEMMHGFGFKVWVDILPIIDVEATFNIQFGSYDASLFMLDPSLALKSAMGMGSGEEYKLEDYKQIDLEIELGGTPFGKANPKFVQMNGDISITYPITFIPIIRPYIGGGLTYYMNTFILNQKFTKRVVGDTYKTLIDTFKDEAEKKVNDIMSDPTKLLDPSADPTSMAMPDQADIMKTVSDAMVENLQDAALEEGLKTSIGGHILVGVRAKLPIIPIAAYANFKYYFGGDFPEEVEPGRMAAEVGVGFAL